MQQKLSLWRDDFDLLSIMLKILSHPQILFHPLNHNKIHLDYLFHHMSHLHRHRCHQLLLIRVCYHRQKLEMQIVDGFKLNCHFLRDSRFGALLLCFEENQGFRGHSF